VLPFPLSLHPAASKTLVEERIARCKRIRLILDDYNIIRGR
jgi:hypothetical protein